MDKDYNDKNDGAKERNEPQGIIRHLPDEGTLEKVLIFLFFRGRAGRTVPGARSGGAFFVRQIVVCSVGGGRR